MSDQLGPAQPLAPKTFHSPLVPAAIWNITAPYVPPGPNVSAVPVTVKGEAEVTITVLPALAVMATFTGVDASLQPPGRVPVDVVPPPASVP